MPAGIMINIDVADLDRATAFYAAVLDVKVGRRLGPDIVELVGGAVPLYLIATPAGTAAGPATNDRRRYTRHWTPVHLDVVVADLDKAVQVCARRRCDARRSTGDTQLGPHRPSCRPVRQWFLPGPIPRPRLRRIDCDWIGAGPPWLRGLSPPVLRRGRAIEISPCAYRWKPARTTAGTSLGPYICMGGASWCWNSSTSGSAPITDIASSGATTEPSISCGSSNTAANGG